MADSYSIKYKDTVWIFTDDQMEPFHDWKEVPYGNVAYKVHVKVDPKPHVVVTRHEPDNRRKYVRIYLSDDIPDSAADASDLIESLTRYN